MYYIAETPNGGRVRASAWVPTDAASLAKAARCAARAHPDRANWLHVGIETDTGIVPIVRRRPGHAPWQQVRQPVMEPNDE